MVEPYTKELVKAEAERDEARGAQVSVDRRTLPRGGRYVSVLRWLKTADREEPITTELVSARLGVTRTAAYKLMSRLAGTGHATRYALGEYGPGPNIDAPVRWKR